MPRGTKLFIHKATGARTSNFGDDLINLIQMYLNDYGFRFKQNETLYRCDFSTKNHIRLPDLYLEDYKKKEANLVIEIDGDIHGTDIASRNGKTKARNQDYNRANVNYIVIHPSELKEYGVSFKDGSAFPLITYMVSEKLAQIQDREE